MDPANRTWQRLRKDKAGFMGLVIVLAFFLIAHDLGGLSSLHDRIRDAAPELLVKGDKPPFAPGAWGSWALSGFPRWTEGFWKRRRHTSTKSSIVP